MVHLRRVRGACVSGGASPSRASKYSPMNRFVRSFSTFVLACGLLGASSPLQGTFALQEGTAKTKAYLQASTGANSLTRQLDIWMTPLASADPILHYSVDMTKLLHLIIVSDDLEQFLHVHPALGGDGRFQIVQRFPVAALYHVYADGTPAGI